MTTLCRLWALLMIFAFTATSAIGVPLEGYNNAAFINPSTKELRLQAHATNVLVDKFGKCRYLSNLNSEASFVPLGSSSDYDSFINNSAQAAELRLCRPEQYLNWNFAAAGLPDSQRLSNNFVPVSVGFEQWSEINADRSDFSSRLEYARAPDDMVDEQHSLSVTYTRLDCRTNRNANGTLRDDPTVCNAASWVETGHMSVNFTPSQDDPRNSLASEGQWSTQALAKTTSNVPPVNIPAQRACGLFAHNTKRWLPTSTGNTRLPTTSECAHGAGTATVSFSREGEYLCFDGIEARTATAEREVNAVMSGSCAPAPDFTPCPAGQAARWQSGNCVPYWPATIVDAEAVADIVTPHGSKTGNFAFFSETSPNQQSFNSAQLACAYRGYPNLLDYAGYDAANCGGSCYWATYNYSGTDPLNLANYSIGWAKVDSRSSGPITESSCGMGPNWLTLRTVSQQSSSTGPVAPPAGISSCASLANSGVDINYSQLMDVRHNHATTRASSNDSRLSQHAGTLCKQPFACYEQTQLPGGLVIDPTNTNCFVWLLGICYRLQSTYTTTVNSCEPAN